MLPTYLIADCPVAVGPPIDATSLVNVHVAFGDKIVHNTCVDENAHMDSLKTMDDLVVQGFKTVRICFSTIVYPLNSYYMVGQSQVTYANSIPYVLEQVLVILLPERLVVVLEEAVLDHLLLVALDQELHDLVGVVHPQALGLLQRVHEVEVERLHCALLHEVLVLARVVFIVEGQAPGCFVLLPLQPDGRVELNANWQAPLQVTPVELEPHRLEVIQVVRWSVGVEEGLHIVQDKVEVVLSRSHDLNEYSVQSTSKTGRRYLRRDCAATQAIGYHPGQGQSSMESAHPTASS